MKVRYVVRRFHLSDDPQHCIARVVPAGTITLEELIDLAAERNTTVARSDLLASAEDLFQLMIERILDGYNVQTPLVDISLVFEGRFEGLQDQFDPQRHKVKAAFRTGWRLRRALRHFRAVELAEDRQRGPAPEDLLDVNSGTHNERLTPGGIAKLWGYRLKFDPADPAQGIFLVAADRQETRVTVVAHTGIKQLFFSLPDLPAGRYRLEVRTIPRNSSSLCRGTLPDALVVA